MFLIVAGCLGMLILAAFIILFVVYYQKKVLTQKNQMQIAENKYQRQLLSAAIQVEEKERERIAKNVHDDVGILLNVLKLNMGQTARHSDNKELVKKLTAENLKLLEDSIQGIRGILKDLVPYTLLRLGYIKALNELCRHINNSDKISVQFFQGNSDTRLPEQTELQLYRITLELINNIIKHTGAKEITIELKQINEHYNLILVHNGKSITTQQVYALSKGQNGLGLKSIQSRAQIINAQVDYSVTENNQPYITVKLPLLTKEKIVENN